MRLHGWARSAQGVALSKENGTRPGNLGKKGKLTNIPEILQTFRKYYKHSGDITNIPDLLHDYY
jgi:hypothetical protein